jgi:hypothetical protein
MNKFKMILNVPDKTENSLLIKNIHDRISSYLRFNVDDLLDETDAAIFGGAVRDSIADLEIHDIDIMALPKSASKIEQFLLQSKFTKLLTGTIDIVNLYCDIKIINLPITFVRDNSIVQIIRPVIPMQINDVKELFNKYLANVDISACGVAYTAGQLIETSDNAILHCKNREFVTLIENMFYRKNRIQHRVAKLLDRGWKQLKDKDKSQFDFDLI